MRSLAVIFCMLCAVVVCGACSPTFKNIKEVNTYLDNQRNSADKMATAEAIDITAINAVGNVLNIAMLPLTLLNPSSIPFERVADTIANSSGAAVAVASLATLRGAVSGGVKFNRREEVYRAEPGQPTKDIVAEAFKSVPKMTSCVPTRISDPRFAGSVKYIGPDGAVRAADYVGFEMHYEGIQGAKPPCKSEEAVEYMRKVVQYIADEANRKKSLINSAAVEKQ